MSADLRDAAKEQFGAVFDDTPDNINKFFYDRIRDNLHIVLAFSPANPKFAERARKFPALINCRNITGSFRGWSTRCRMSRTSSYVVSKGLSPRGR